jgi:hypothetical protein
MTARSFLYGWMMVATIGLVSLSLALLNAMTEVGQSVVIAEAAVNTTNTTGPNGTNTTATAGAAGRTMFLSVCLIMSLGALGAQIQALILSGTSSSSPPGRSFTSNAPLSVPPSPYSLSPL